MKKIYDEIEYAKIIKEKGFQTTCIKYELTVLVKYLTQVENMNKKNVEKFIYTFCTKYIEGYNEVIYFKIIDNAIKKGRMKKNKLIVVKDIPILKQELQYLDSLNLDIQYKKLLLSFIINKKISLEISTILNGESELSIYFEGSMKKYREIYKMANINSTKYKVNDMINVLVQNNIVESIVKGDILLSFIGDIYDNYDEEIIIQNKYTKEKEVKIKKHIQYEYNEKDIYEKINDFEDVGYIFDFYKNDKKIKKCEVCGKYIKINGVKDNSKKYCKECANKQNIIKTMQNRKSLKARTL